MGRGVRRWRSRFPKARRRGPKASVGRATPRTGRSARGRRCRGRRALLAPAKIGVHLVFFLHLGSGPNDTNNLLARALVVLIALLVIAGSIRIVAHLNANMMPMPVS